MKSKRRKLLATVVALSLMTTNVITVGNAIPACMPEDPLIGMEEQVEEKNNKVKNKKRCFV